MIRISVHYIAVVPPTEGKSTTNRDEGIQVLRRAVAALDEIAAEPGHLRLVDLCERLGLAKSTTRRLLVGLVEVGLVSVDSHGRFALGERLLGFGSVTGAHIAAAFRPTVERVARATDGETVDLSVLRGQRMWFVDQIESSSGMACFPRPPNALVPKLFRRPAICAVERRCATRRTRSLRGTAEER